jgi:hypothetical protein
LADLKKVDQKYGVEIDIRSEGRLLILQHDPFTAGESFDEWLKAYQHQTLILNVKEEGLENRIIELLKKYNISNYFFLDQSFPFLIKWSSFGEHRCAVRVSEYESIKTALSLSGKVDWVWVDCFSKFPLDSKSALCLKTAGFKLCLVSPELQGRDGKYEIPILAKYLDRELIKVDAICTKLPYLWERMDLRK